MAANTLYDSNRKERKGGDTWTHPYTGRVYRWNVARGLWVGTDEYIPVPSYDDGPNPG
jgi:hypothetical protein